MSGDSLVAAYPRLLVENYCILASTGLFAALLWFDFALTFPTEVRRIWGREFSGATLVYLFTRYTALLDRVLFVTEVLLWNSSNQTCGRISRADDVMVTLNYFAFSAFTSLRVYGVWGRDWKPLLVVVPLTLIKPALWFSDMKLQYEIAHYSPVQGGAPFGCFYNYTLSDVTMADLAKAATIASDAILICLTWVKTFGINKESSRLGMRTPLATLLLRDGTAYFIVLLLVQVITIVSSQVGSTILVWLVWPYFDQVLTVIFLSRFMLDLRGLHFSERQPPGISGAESTAKMSDIRFDSSRVVGNLGATLSYPDFTSRTSISSRASEHPHDLEIEEVERDRAEWPWYGDEKAMYADDPFKAGLRPQPPVVVDIIELEEPLSPFSPTSYQGGSQASSSQLFSHA
ncbi:hypothetical protein LXA43DRAFT_1062142 [Ganoderma leucocontextum]|nr:hypothetical protein LXA43DRAFT_1062142 [Ganoderma leucocontextum]